MRKNLTPKNNKKDIMSLVYVCFGIAIFTFLFTYFSNMLVQKSYKLSYDELFYDRVFWGLDLRNNIIFHGFSTILVKRIIESKYFVNYKNVLNILFLIKSFLSALTSVLMFLIVKRISCANNLTKILLAVFTTILIFSKPGILVEVPLNVLCVLGIICFYSQSFFCKGKIKPIVFNLLVIIFAIILISNSFSMLFLVPAIVFILLKNPKNKIINIVSSIVLVVAGILIVLYFYYQYVPNNIYPGSIIENISNTPQYLVSKMEKAVLTLKSDWKSFSFVFNSTVWMISVRYSSYLGETFSNPNIIDFFSFKCSHISSDCSKEVGCFITIFTSYFYFFIFTTCAIGNI